MAPRRLFETYRRGVREALGWVAADPYGTVTVEPNEAAGAPGAQAAFDPVVEAWRHRIRRSRLAVRIRRAATVAVLAVATPELVAAAIGTSLGARIATLAAGVAAFVAVLAAQARRPVTMRAAGTILDRDLGLADTVSTALELEQNGRHAGSPRLRGLVADDAARVLTGTLTRYRARPAHGGREWVVLFSGALVAAIGVAIPARTPAGGGAQPVAQSSSSRGAAPLPALRGFASPPTGARTRRRPHLTGVAPGAGKPGALSGHSPYGGGVASRGAAADVAPTRPLPSRTSQHATAPSTGNARASESASHGGTGGADRAGTAGSHSSGGSIRALGPSSSSAAGTSAARAASAAGGSPGGNGAAGVATRSGSAAARGRSGGATAGGTRARKSSTAGLVPQLGFGGRLPIAGGFDAVRDTGGRGATTSAAGGGGGGARSIGAGGGGAAGAATYLPPGVTAAGTAERQLLLAFFSGTTGRTPSHW